jgi:hypothetical protein
LILVESGEHMSDNFSLDGLLGLTEEVAVAKIVEAGFLPSVGRAIDPLAPVSPNADIKMNRVNIVMTHNVVTKAYFG